MATFVSIFFNQGEKSIGYPNLYGDSENEGVCLFVVSLFSKDEISSL